MKRFIIDENLRWLTEDEMKAGTWCNIGACPIKCCTLPFGCNVALTKDNIFVPCLIIELLNERKTRLIPPLYEVLEYRVAKVAFRDVFGNFEVCHVTLGVDKLRALHPIQMLRMTAAGQLIKKYLLRWREHLKYKIGSENYEKAKTEFYSLS